MTFLKIDGWFYLKDCKKKPSDHICDNAGNCETCFFGSMLQERVDALKSYFTIKNARNALKLYFAFETIPVKSKIMILKREENITNMGTFNKPSVYVYQGSVFKRIDTNKNNCHLCYFFAMGCPEIDPDNTIKPLTERDLCTTKDDGLCQIEWYPLELIPRVLFFDKERSV